MNYLKRLEDEVSAWPNVSAHPHRFGGREFRFQSAEVAHVHTGGIVDIPFPRRLRDALLAEGVAEEHYWVPNSGWVTFRVRNEDDLTHALWLMRLSYLRYAIKSATDPRKLRERESEELRLSPQYFLRGRMPSDNARQHTLVDILQPASSGYALDLFTKDEIEKLHVYDKNGKPYLRCLVSYRERPAKPEEIVRQLFLRRITMSAHTPE